MKLSLLSNLFLLSLFILSLSKRVYFIEENTETTKTDFGETKLLIPLTFTSLRKAINVIYDTSSNILVINRNELDDNQLPHSIRNQKETIITPYGTFNGKIYSQKVSVPLTLEAQYSEFILAENINYNNKRELNTSIWGLGRHLGNFTFNQYSNRTLIEKLYDNELIPYSNFGHRFVNQRYPYFFYGEFFIEDDCYSCKSQDEGILGDNWNCKMQIVKFSTEFAITVTIRDGVFATGLNKIVLPKEDYDRLLEDFSRLALCNVTGTQPLKVKCESNVTISSFPNITFTFDSFNLHLNSTDYMRPISPNRNEYISNIEYSDTNDYWLLGLPLLKKYDMLFDYETNNVFFLTLIKEDFISISNPKFKVALISFSSSLVLFIMYICYIIFRRKTIKKKKVLLPKSKIKIKGKLKKQHNEKDSNDEEKLERKRTIKSNVV